MYPEYPLSSAKASDARPEDTKTNTTQICSRCHHVCRPGEVICSRCYNRLGSPGMTRMLDANSIPARRHHSITGTAISAQQKPIHFELEGQQLPLPVAESVTVGRLTQLPGEVQPDITLNAFQAFEKGVSRFHMKIVRKSELIYAVDLGSSNGTFLNGIRLMPNQERLLRSGDELLLGKLSLKVKF